MNRSLWPLLWIRACNDIAQLKGKKIGITTPGSKTDGLVESVLTRPRFTEAEFETLQSDTLALEPELKPISYDDFNPDFIGQ